MQRRCAVKRNYFPSIIGNAALTVRLSRDIDDGMLSHAYILEGPTGSGRHNLAHALVAALSCERRRDPSYSGEIPCKCCKTCQKIFAYSETDIHTVGLEEDRVTLGVESIRQIKNGLYTAPGDLAYKVYIIESADKMTEEAQNAFLLSLEEPPAYILFFLICENSANLLETVRSRAPTLRMEPISEKEIEEYLLANEKAAKQLKADTPQDLHRLIFLANGCIGRAITLLEQKKRKEIFENYNAAEELLKQIIKKDRISAYSSIMSYGTKRPEVIAKLMTLQSALRDLILLKKSEEVVLGFFEDRERASDLANSFTSPALFSLYDATAVAIGDLERNANVRLSLMTLIDSADIL